MTQHTTIPARAHAWEEAQKQTKPSHRILFEAMWRNKPLLAYYIGITLFSWSPSLYQTITQGEWSGLLISVFVSGATLFLAYWMIEAVIATKGDTR